MTTTIVMVPEMPVVTFVTKEKIMAWWKWLVLIGGIALMIACMAWPSWCIYRVLKARMKYEEEVDNDIS